jgi:histone acetyltransferase (RNA polymerase elongator complex component)
MPCSLPPGRFSCPADCFYCPDEPGQPRSYLSTEPAVARANQNDFDPVRQFFDRALTLAKQGHVVDKIEIIVLGGTWSAYPRDYQEEFCRDLFYAANCWSGEMERGMRGGLFSLKEGVAERETEPVDHLHQKFDGSETHLKSHAHDREEHTTVDGAVNKILSPTISESISTDGAVKQAMKRRKRGTIAEEQELNENASCKIIGLTLETRPDHINHHEIRR